MRQPYFNMVSLPYGKTHFDKPLRDNVYHEADMKLSCDIHIDKYLGDFYHKISSGSDTISHMLVHVFHVTVAPGQLTSKQPGEAFWAHPDHLQQSEFVPGFTETMRWIKSHQTQEPAVTEIESSLTRPDHTK